MAEEQQSDQEIEEQLEDKESSSAWQRYGLIGIAAVFGLIIGLGLSPVVCDSCEASEACPEDDEQYGPLVGFHAPLFELDDSEGNRHSLLEVRGEKTVVVLFEVTTCIWCQRLSEHVEALRTEYDDVEFWTVDMGEPSSVVSSYRSERGIERPWLLDSDGEVSKTYGVSGTPNIFIVDKDGKIAVVQPGYVEESDFRSMIEQAR